MMFPILLLLGIGTIAYVSSRQPTITTLQQIRGVKIHNPRAHLQALAIIIKRGQAPQRWLVNEAMREAYDLGDWKAVSVLSSSFPISQTAVSGESPTPDSELEVTHTKATIVIGKNSPLKGVGNEEWGEFVEKLKTQNPSYASDRHVGAYHHNLERLSQLEIDPKSLTDESAQYQALEKDLSAQFAVEKKLINELAGDIVEIDGVEHPISSSGVLGVLKSAGPKHARSWFKNPEERKQFPQTTEMFLRTNGIF